MCLNETLQGASWWAQHLRNIPKSCKVKVTSEQADSFSDNLCKLLRVKYEGHWYADKPTRASGYRAISYDIRMDPVLMEAAEMCGISENHMKQLLHHKRYTIMFINPGEVKTSIFESPFDMIWTSEAPDSPDTAAKKLRSSAPVFVPVPKRPSALTYEPRFVPSPPLSRNRTPSPELLRTPPLVQTRSHQSPMIHQSRPHSRQQPSMHHHNTTPSYTSPQSGNRSHNPSLGNHSISHNLNFNHKHMSHHNHHSTYTYGNVNHTQSQPLPTHRDPTYETGFSSFSNSHPRDQDFNRIQMVLS